MLRVGLTGNIASGKSHATQVFAELGAHIIDADVIAHRVVDARHEYLRAGRCGIWRSDPKPGCHHQPSKVGRDSFSGRGEESRTEWPGASGGPCPGPPPNRGTGRLGAKWHRHHRCRPHGGVGVLPHFRSPHRSPLQPSLQLSRIVSRDGLTAHPGSGADGRADARGGEDQTCRLHNRDVRYVSTDSRADRNHLPETCFC